MRIALVSHSMNVPDEGVRVVGAAIAKEMARLADVEEYDLDSVGEIRKMKEFNPDLCHYFMSFSDAKSVIVPWLTCRIILRKKYCVSALQPRLNPVMKILLRKMRPDLVLVQSEEALDFFRSCSVESELVDHGADAERFSPKNSNDKCLLRDKYNIPRDSKVILHVGAIQRARGTVIMKELVEKDRYVLLVGRESTPIDLKLRDDLLQSGCHVWNRYLPNIEEVYQLSDVYIFPTENPSSSIDLPLSVLEAVASGCLVVSTRFRGIPSWVRSRGLQQEVTLVRNAQEIPCAVDYLLSSRNSNRTEKGRRKVADWIDVARSVHIMYQKLLGLPSLRKPEPNSG